MKRFYYIPEVKKEILDYIKKNKITVLHFCILSGISRAWYYKIMRGKTRHLKNKTIKRLQFMGLMGKPDN